MTDFNFNLFTKNDFNDIINIASERITEIKDLITNYDDYDYIPENDNDYIHRMMSIINEKLKINNTKNISSERVYQEIFKYNELQNINIDFNKYNAILPFGDIHADLFIFIELMIKNNIIVFTNERNENINSFIINELSSLPLIVTNPLVPVDKMLSNDMYNPKCLLLYNILKLYDFTVGVKDTLIIFTGDILDGKRVNHSTGNITEVYNPFGINELLIHMIIHNIRKHCHTIPNINSNIVTLCGNHEISNLFDTNRINASSYYYVDISTLCVLGVIPRRKMLIPFYLFDLGLFRFIKNNNKVIAFFQHGSINDHEIKYIKLIGLYGINQLFRCAVYKNIQNNRLLSDTNNNISYIDEPDMVNVNVNEISKIVASFTIFRNIYNFYDAQSYGNMKILYNKFNTELNKNEGDVIIVMGHHPTSILENNIRLMNTLPNYNNNECIDGCQMNVLFNKLAFVDVGYSHVFRSGKYLMQNLSAHTIKQVMGLPYIPNSDDERKIFPSQLSHIDQTYYLFHRSIENLILIRRENNYIFHTLKSLTNNTELSLFLIRPHADQSLINPQTIVGIKDVIHLDVLTPIKIIYPIAQNVPDFKIIQSGGNIELKKLVEQLMKKYY
jgi:hypothetical protein